MPANRFRLARRSRPAAASSRVARLPAAILFLASALGQGALPAEEGAQQQPEPSALARWLNPAMVPIIPVPEIDVDPNTGTTLGVIPISLRTDAAGHINRILAPDLIHTQDFGWGARFRIFAYPSEDEQWFVVAGGKQRVESEFDARYEAGRLRTGHWSWTLEAIYDRSGTDRFYGIGNASRSFDRSVYTNQQSLVRVILGRNFTREWQLSYYLMPRNIRIVSAFLPGIPSTTRRYERLLGIGTTNEIAHRLALIYDSRDNLVVPTRGWYLVGYGGVATRDSDWFDNSLYSEFGADVRTYWSPSPTLTWAAHAALRYLPVARHAPFWALSSIGGEVSEPGGSETLRGYGQSRFYDRNSSTFNLEMRKTVGVVDAMSTRIELQLTPFLDAGRVFRRASTSPISKLHGAGGLGVRALARPSIVGYLDVGVGSEGPAVFTGINYPF